MGVNSSKTFFKTLGKNYINFDMSNINSATEIKLLTEVALFMEMQKQNKGHISRCIKKLINERKNKNIKVLNTIKEKTTGGSITINIVNASYSKKKNNHK